MTSTPHRHRSRRTPRVPIPAAALAATALAAACASVLATPTPASALMPPHVQSTDPANGGTLVGTVVRFVGYSLDYADKEASAQDLTAKAKVATSVDVRCEWVGKGDCAGCKQQKCVAAVTLAKVVSGHRYRVSYLDTIIEVVGGPALVPKPDTPRRPAPKPAPHPVPKPEPTPPPKPLEGPKRGR